MYALERTGIGVVKFAASLGLLPLACGGGEAAPLRGDVPALSAGCEGALERPLRAREAAGFSGAVAIALPTPPEQFKLPPEVLAPLAGTYTLDAGGDLSVAAEDGGIAITAVGGAAVRVLFPISDAIDPATVLEHELAADGFFADDTGDRPGRLGAVGGGRGGAGAAGGGTMT